MFLRVATTAFFILGLVLLLAWPWIVGARPSAEASKPEQVAYAVRFVTYISGLLLVFFTTSICAWLLARKRRMEFQKESLDNLKDLIEGTLHDHGRTKDS
jgi:MFS superfamily sulfate permease-like transporter